MASVIPLSAPDGTVYAYACGVCRHIRASLSSLGPNDAAAIASIAEFSQGDADRCCRCERCKAVAGPFNFGSPHVCAGCLPAHETEKEARLARCREAAERSERVQTERLRASKDEASARALAALMSEISEECWCAGWMSGLEFSLWAVVCGEERDYGMSEISEQEVADLRSLSDKCGGWIRWEDDVGEVFVQDEEWRRIYNLHDCAP